MMDPINEAVRQMAFDINQKAMAEKELLTARFIVENPTVPIKDVTLVEQRKPDGVVFYVREKSNWEKLDGAKM